ncbi:MAG TPA: xanthine dehydrogenase accessory protein XdhC [Lacipirellulaceae bacterium]|jgi:xanthine dehydrogenase accessory factor|nr:xanthine dehydrogenase accessory protein XdhC [Lacipirellulaceae bacterium]
MPTPHGFVERLAELSQAGVPFVSVTMVEAIGSTPQDTGSKMLVTGAGIVTGTVGGGRVEHKAIEHAREMLSRPAGQAPLTDLVDWNLKRDVGMTCGGSVKLFFETYNHSDWRIVVFGAGHVASEVVSCLGRLDCHVTCVDSRPEWLERIPPGGRLRKVCSADPRELVAQLSDDSFVICMTMGHATDRPILEDIFRQGRKFPFLGVIGSKAKRAVLLKELTASGIPTEQASSFACPIGLDLGTNQPGEIAISVVAQLIQKRDEWRGANNA